MPGLRLGWLSSDRLNPGDAAPVVDADAELLPGPPAREAIVRSRRVCRFEFFPGAGGSEAVRASLGESPMPSFYQQRSTNLKS